MQRNFSTFFITVIAWVFFRVESISYAFSYLKGIFSKSLFVLPKGSDFALTSLHPFTMFSLLLGFIFFEWLGRENQYAIQKTGLKWNPIFRYSFYYMILILILWFGAKEQEFIYFQF